MGLLECKKLDVGLIRIRLFMFFLLHFTFSTKLRLMCDLCDINEVLLINFGGNERGETLISGGCFFVVVSF